MQSGIQSDPISVGAATKEKYRLSGNLGGGQAATPRVQFTLPIDWDDVLPRYYLSACRDIKRKMPRCLWARYDPEDFVADAIVELMNKPAPFVEYGPGLLVLIAKRRMIDAAKSPRSRAVRLEVDVMDRQPEAHLRFEAAERRESMLGRTHDPRSRAMLALRLEGHSLPEIAEMSGRGLRMVQRFFRKFAKANQPR